MTEDDWKKVQKMIDEAIHKARFGQVDYPGNLPPLYPPIQLQQPMATGASCSVCGITWQSGVAYGYACANANCPSRPWS